MGLDDLLGELTAQIVALAARVDELERMEHGAWRGTSAVDFSVITLPNPGDYGFQTTDRELQVNVGGNIRAIWMSAL